MTIAILATLLFQAGALTSESSTGEQVSAVSKPTAEARHWGNLTLAPGVSRPAIIKGDPAWVQGDDRPPGVSDDVHGRTVADGGQVSQGLVHQLGGDPAAGAGAGDALLQQHQPELVEAVFGVARRGVMGEIGGLDHLGQVERGLPNAGDVLRFQVRRNAAGMAGNGKAGGVLLGGGLHVKEGLPRGAGRASCVAKRCPQNPVA